MCAGIIGPQGSGKSLDLLFPALLGAPGAALVTLTKPDDLLLVYQARKAPRFPGGPERPALVCDPFGLVEGLDELVWDPVAGCADPMVAEKRAKAFTAGTIKANSGGGSDAAARFYASESAKVLMAYLHAAALIGANLAKVLPWVANPLGANHPFDILKAHPDAAPMWFNLLEGALHGDERTVSNTITTLQQAMSLFMQPSILNRCVPSPGKQATDIARIIREGGTFFMLGREDPYQSASPLMTALTEHILDTALEVGNQSPYRKLCPPMLACLDELPSTAPIPTLRTRMANERALGISFLWAAQTRRQLSAIFGDQEAKSIWALSNVLVIFGGSKDAEYNKEVSDLVGSVRVARTSKQLKLEGGVTATAEDIPILRPEEIRQIPTRQALVLAGNASPMLAKLQRCVEGNTGKELLAQQEALREQLHSRQAEKNDQFGLQVVEKARKVGLI
jgi:type IV secretion system protein VirD4